MVEVTTTVLFFLIVYGVARRVPAVFYAVVGAYFLRLGAACVNLYLFRLPDGDKDALGFEQTAWDLAQLPWELFVASFDYTSAFFSYGWIVALPYRLVGRVEFVPQMINVLLGSLVVYFVYRAVQRTWNQQIAIHAAWVTALFPQLIHYSAVLLRESIIHFCLSVCVYYFVRYLHSHRRSRPRDILIALGFACIATIFHGGMVVVVIGILLYFVWRAVRLFYLGRSTTVRELLTIGTLVLVFFPLTLQFSITQLELGSIGAVQELVDPSEFADEASRAANVRLRGGAAYPEFLAVSSAPSLAIKVIPRAAYLLFSPFPWDVREFYHILGFFDGLIYILIGYTLYKRWEFIRSSNKLILLLLFLVPLVFTFAIGTSNFGTGIRHRAKIVVVLLVVSGGFRTIFGGARLWSAPPQR